MTGHFRRDLTLRQLRALAAVRDVDILHQQGPPLFENSDAPLFGRRGLFR